MMLPTTCLYTGYDLTIFKICKSAYYYKIVEAAEIVGSRRKSWEAVGSRRIVGAS